MSGPKVDIAEVRHQELMKLAEAREGRRNLSDKIQKLINQVSNYIGSDLDLMMQDELLRPNCEHIQNLQNDCLKELKRMLSIVKSGNEMLNVEELTAKSQQLVIKFNKDAQGGLALVGELAKSSQKFQEIKANRQQLEQAKKKQIVRLSNTDMDSDIEVSDADVEELVETFKGELSE